ncbi:MAG: tyrosine--tRNA ligase, partial [Kofleriaceae bacterium]|nr:tyrosine--tRNA ligase [Kofleriaceae bacterium]
LYGLTNPLLLDSSGQKMGKTSSGTRVWLDPNLTSPYDFYQYFLRSDDSEIDKLLRLFSWRSLDEIAAIVAEHAGAPELRIGQKALAEDLTMWVHGADALTKAKVTSQVVFGDGLDQLCDADLLLTDLPFSQVTQSELEEGVLLLDLMQAAGLVKSKGEARRLVSGGGVYINNIRTDDPTRSVSVADLCTETMMIIRCGKKKYHIVRITS